jgi:tRNA pseudouridine55 synthase
MARKRKGRAVDGVLLLDKPAGMSSNHALQRAKRMLQAAKAGHTGSLDPLATGVLPLCFGEATKFSQLLLDADKRYRSTFALGVTTTTGDADGEVTGQTSAAGVSREQVEAALRQFVGEISQVPSMYSALKHEGQPLYKLARQGIEIDYCPKCRGVWLDRGELDKLIERADRLDEPPSHSRGGEHRDRPKKKKNLLSELFELGG